MERSVLQELSAYKNCVIATGGGVVCRCVCHACSVTCSSTVSLTSIASASRPLGGRQ
jgi:shikimate kinase